MLDAAVASFVVMGDAHFLRELTGYHNLIGGIDILLRGEMIHDKIHLVLVKNLARAHTSEGFDCERGGDIVGEYR